MKRPELNSKGLASRLVLLVAFMVVTQSCGESGISFVPMMISNKDAEARYISASKNRDSLLEFFENLENRSMAGFDWNRWWNFLATQDPSFSQEDSEGWQTVFNLSHRACASDEFWKSYYDYLESLYGKRAHSPRMDSFSSLENCRLNLPEDLAEGLLLRELNDASPSIERIRYFSRSASAEFFTEMHVDEWSRLTGILLFEATGEENHEEARSLVRYFSLTDDDLSIRHLQVTYLLTLLNDSQSIDENEKELRRYLLMLASRDSALDTSNYFEWWKGYVEVIAKNFHLGNFDLERYIYEVDQSLLVLKRKHFFPDPQSRMNEWLNLFDATFNSIFRMIADRPELRIGWAEIYSSRAKPSAALLWLNTLLNKRGFERSDWDELEGRYNENPLYEWIEWRVRLRSMLDRDDLSKKVPSDGQFEMNWWGPDEQCPIPKISGNAEIEFDRAWIDGVEASGKGCFVLEDLQVPTLANYDILLSMPGSSLVGALPGGVILDLSGRPGSDQDYHIRAAQDGMSFPSFLVENFRDRFDIRNRLRRSQNEPIQVLIFHVLTSEPIEPIFLTSDGETIVQPTPEDGEHGGDLNLSSEPDLPVWVRSFGGPGAAAVSGLPPGPEIRLTSLRENFGFLRASLGSFIQAQWESERAEVFPGIQILRIASASDLQAIDIQDFQVLSLSETEVLLGESNSDLATRFRAELIFDDEPISDLEWNGLVRSHFQNLDSFDARLFQAFHSDPLLLAATPPIDPTEFGVSGNPGSLPVTSSKAYTFRGVVK